jgi:protein gp37
VSSAIEWTDETWNPTLGCTVVSEGCRNCYAARESIRLAGRFPHYEGLAEMRGVREGRRAVFTGEVQLMPDRLEQPFHWRKPRRVFVDSMSDLFHPTVPDDFIDHVFAVMALSPLHTFQVLTKRPERMAAYLQHFYERATLPPPSLFISHGTAAIQDYLSERFFLFAEESERLAKIHDAGWKKHVGGVFGILPNVWLGTSVEDQAAADERIPHLLRTPAAVRFLSCEPLLGPIELFGMGRAATLCPACGLKYDHDFDVGGTGCRGLDWIIVGGESGPHARPMHPEWARCLRDACRAAGVSFFFKQWGEFRPFDRDRLDGSSLVKEDGTCVERARVLQRRGDTEFFEDLIDRGHPYWSRMVRVGKKRAGRLLDGRLWDEIPTTFPNAR